MVDFMEQWLFFSTFKIIFTSMIDAILLDLDRY